MSRTTRAWLLAACAIGPSLLGLTSAAYSQGIPQNIPRNETLILENPEGTIKNAGWFNIWAINAGSQSNGLQQVGLDTLWYIDPESGHRRGLGQLAGLREAHLQRRLHRDDGEAAQGHLLERRRRVHGRRRGRHRRDPDQEPGDALRAPCWPTTSPAIETPDRNTVVFKLKKPNSRFHALLHGALERASGSCRSTSSRRSTDPLKFDFNKPVSLGAYTLHSYDPERQVVHLAAARRLAAHDRSAASASRGRNISPMSIRARRTSA